MLGMNEFSLNKVKDVFRVFYFALLAAGLIHVFFLLLFLYLDIQILAALNVISILIYLLCVYLFFKASSSEDYRVVASIVIAEVIGHAYIVSYYIGLSSGFHYYILLLTIIPMVNVGILFYANLIRLLVLASAYVFLLLWLDDAVPLYQIDPNFLKITRSVNVVLLIFGIGAVTLEVLSKKVKENELLSDLAKTDKLTGLYNRHGFMGLVEQEINAKARHSDALSILAVDIDLFKNINDQYGHQCGDYVLKTLAKVMRHVLRKHEMITRWGGDEFIVLLPSTGEEELTKLAERLCKEVAQTQFQYHHMTIPVTVSIGGTMYRPADTFEAIISRADSALFKAKEAGRNAFYIG